MGHIYEDHGTIDDQDDAEGAFAAHWREAGHREASR